MNAVNAVNAVNAENPKPAQTRDPLTLTHFDVDQLVKHVTDTGKILPRRITGMSAKQQRHMTKMVKQARALLLMK